jgi:carbonic anhydrase
VRTILACLLAFPLAACAPAGDCSWSYTGARGPDHWWEICPPQNALCKDGTEQSPIDLGGARPDNLPGLVFDYRPTRPTQFTVEPMYFGQELQAKAPQDDERRLYLRVGSERYHLVQFHFHTPCEHCRDRSERWMELHLVHQNDSGETAVVGVLMEDGGARNAAFQAFVETIPPTGTPGGIAELQPLDLLPSARDYFYYDGSLTTPACAEGVLWHVLREPISVSSDQMTRFRSRYPHTARPLQTRGDRTVLRSRN